MVKFRRHVIIHRLGQGRTKLTYMWPTILIDLEISHHSKVLFQNLRWIEQILHCRWAKFLPRCLFLKVVKCPDWDVFCKLVVNEATARDMLSSWFGQMNSHKQSRNLSRKVFWRRFGGVLYHLQTFARWPWLRQVHLLWVRSAYLCKWRSLIHQIGVAMDNLECWQATQVPPMKRAKAGRDGLAKAMLFSSHSLFFQAVCCGFGEFMHGGWCAEHWTWTGNLW